MTTTTFATADPVELAGMHDGIPTGEPDPYFGPCPEWCEDAIAGTAHPVVSCDEDRVHHGATAVIPVRSITFEYLARAAAGDKATYFPGYLQSYVRQNVAHRDPTIWVGINETNKGVSLTIDEADALAAALRDQVESARAGDPR